jgi:hypothetical protein
MEWRGLQGPLGCHHSSAIRENFSISSGFTVEDDEVADESIAAACVSMPILRRLTPPPYNPFLKNISRYHLFWF